jgi:integrase
VCQSRFEQSKQPLVECAWCHNPCRRPKGHTPLCSKACFKAWREEPLNKRLGRFRPLLEAIIADYAQRSTPTRHELRSNAGQFLVFLAKRKMRSINSVRYLHLTEFLEEMRQGGWTQLNSMVRSIKLFFDWAIVTGRRKYANPVLPRFHRIRMPKRLPRPYSDDELALIWRLLEASGDKALLAAVAFGEESGCRISEVANLRLEVLDLEKQQAFVRLPNKTSREYFVPFHDKAKRYLAAWLEVRGQHDHDFVFVGPTGRPMAKATFASASTVC